MCRTKSARATSKELEERYKALVSEGFEYRPEYVENGYEHKPTAIITSEKPDLIQPGYWGLIPSWVKDFDRAKQAADSNLNARSETIFEKVSFKEYIMRQRCLILVTGFFETQHFMGGKYPYHISVKNEKIFSLGGIYSNYYDSIRKEMIITYSIITVPANEMMKKIHNHGENKHRMPMILDQKDEAKWLDLKISEVEVKDLMVTCSDDLLESYTVSRNVNAPKPNNNPDSIKPWDYPELGFLDF